METINDYKIILKNELNRRVDTNQNYSLRAYASSMQIDSGALSRIISGKQIPSKSIVSKILENTIFEASVQEIFIQSVRDAQNNRTLIRKNSFITGPDSKEKATVFRPLEVDLFKVMGEWFHSAIMELTFVKGFIASPKWIGRNLKISETQAMLAIDRLISLGLLKKDKDEKLIKTDQFIDTKDKHLTTPALKKNQKELLEKAIVSLENDPIEERSMTSMTMAIDETKIEEAKKLIIDFNQKMSEFMEEGDQTRIYNLQVALYPLGQKTN